MATLNDMGYKKVFVSLDGTEQQDKVLERAIVVAANNNAELIIGHVIDSTILETSGSYPTDLIPGLDKAFRDSIAGLVAKAEANPDIPKVEVQVKTGRIRETLKELFGAELADGIRVLYGGSAKPGNIAELVAKPDVDGALVGGASLKAEDFSAMVVKAGE